MFSLNPKRLFILLGIALAAQTLSLHAGIGIQHKITDGEGGAGGYACKEACQATFNSTINNGGDVDSALATLTACYNKCDGL